jgi:hypothetical protein
MDTRHFHIAPIFRDLQATAQCSSPGCTREAVYMTAWPAKSETVYQPQYWHALLICRQHFEEAKQAYENTIAERARE